MNGCVVPSDCFIADSAGIEEPTSEKKEVIKITDLIGRETEFKPNTVLIYIYSDGTTRKVFKIEK